jgi:hypothetical protein
MPSKRPRPDELEPIERASRDELRALQLTRLRWSVKHAYDNVPHYRKAFAAKGVQPGDLKTLEDLAHFPFTVKSDLRDNYPFGMFAVPREQVSRIHASSGTTGKPTVVGYTRKDIDTWASVMARSIRAAGGRAGDILHVAYGYGLFTGGLGAHYGAEKLGCTVIPMSGGQTEKQVQLIQDFKPSVIMVTPSYMLAIAEEMERQGIDPATSSLEIGIFGAEPWTPTMRLAIEAKLAMDAIDIYGLSEVMGPGVAQECIETKDGLTIWEDHFYPEIVDPETGAVVPDGEQGELDASAAADRPRDAPHGKNHRPVRRHDDHSRRKRVPDADRGADPEGRRTCTPLPARDHAAGEPGRADGHGGARAGVRFGRRQRGRHASRASHQEHDRRHGGGARGRTRQHRALTRQGQADRRQTAEELSRIRQRREMALRLARMEYR